MTEITDEILSKLDYDEVKNKKIFQKFLALQQNGAAQPERTNFQDNENDEHDQNPEAPQDRSRMHTITEESRSHTNLSPDRKNTSLRMKNHGNNNNANYDKNDSYDKRIHSEDDNYHRRQDNYAQQDQFRSSQGQQQSQQFHDDRQQQYSPQQFSRQQHTSPGRGQQQDNHGELENSSKLVNGDYFSNSVGNRNIDRRNQHYDDSRDQQYPYPGYQNRKYSPQQQQQQQQQYQRDGVWNEQDQYNLRPFDHNNSNYYNNSNNPNNFRNRGMVDQSYDERRDAGNRIGYDSDMRGIMMRGRGYEQGGPRGLEERCADQEQQLNRMAAYIQDFKEQSFRESSRAKTQMLELDTTIQALKERLYDLQRREDELTQENEKLKQRITHEQALRTSTEEDLRAANARIEEIKDVLEESKRENQRKESESAYIRQQMEAMKQKHSQALASSEQTVSQLREEKEQLTREMDFSMGNGRQLAEMQEKTAALQNENKRVYQELDESKKAALELTHLAEQHKNELYSAKHRLIEKAQRETQLSSRIESQAAEIETLKQLLHRAEASLLSGDGQDGLVQQRGNYQEPGYLNTQNANGRSAGNLARPRENRNNNNNASLGQMNATTAEPLWGQRQNQGYSPQRALKTSDDIDRSPEQFGTRRSNNNNKSIGAIGQQQPADARRISAENKNISIQLRNKNTNTPSNFLSWEVPDQQSAFSKEKDKRQQGQQQQQQQDSRQVGNVQIRDDSVDRMYRNVQQQLGRDQQYVSEQFQLQAQQKFNSKQQQQHQVEQFNPPQNQASRGNRHADAGDYSQIYNQYNKQETASPEGRRGREKNQVEQSEQVKGIESNLLLLNVEKDQLSSELSKLEQVKLKSAQNIRRRNEITEELSLIQNNISSLKTKLREANALY